MRILFVTPPPHLPNRLHRVRSFDLIKTLARKHEVHLVAVTSESNKSEEFEEVEKICTSVTIIKVNKIFAFLNFLRFYFLPAEVAYCYSEKVTKMIHDIVRKKRIDLIYLKRLRSTIFLNSIKTPIVVDTTDAMSMFYFRMYENHPFPKNFLYLFEAVKYRTYEKKVMETIKHWITCSAIDKKYLETIDSSISVHVIPNPVDTNYFKSTERPRDATILYRGLMDKPVNIDAVIYFVKHMLPRIKKKLPHVKLYIVGPKPASKIRTLMNDKNIFVVGFAKDVRRLMSETAVSVCPVRIGTGTRFKILHSWSMERPVVSTAIGAEGLEYTNGENILIADTPESFSKNVIQLLQNKKLYRKLAKNARYLAEKEYSTKALSFKLEHMLKKVKNEQNN